MFLQLISFLTMVLLLISFVAVVWLGRSRLWPPAPIEPVEPVQPQPALPENKEENLFFAEYIPADFHRLAVGFHASPEVQRGLLMAGDTLLELLSDDIRRRLNTPISCNRMEWLLQGGNMADITPERVRAAIGVAEVSQSIWTIILEWNYRVDRFSYQTVLDKRVDIFFSDSRQNRIAQHIVNQISGGIGITPDMAIEIWRKIVEIMYNDLAGIPGIRISKTSIFNQAVA